MRHIECEYEEVSVEGRRISNLRHTNDIAITAENEIELQILGERVNQEEKDVGMTINIKKTMTMVVSRINEIPRVKIYLDGQEAEQVSKCVYFGELITGNRKSEDEICRRI